jgi:hypothetical protein
LFVKPHHSDAIFVSELAAKDIKTFLLPGDPPSPEETRITARISLFGASAEIVSTSTGTAIEAPPEIEFCDASGRWWRRNPRRRLRRIRRRTLGTKKEVTNPTRFPVEVDGEKIYPGEVRRVQ